MLPSSKALANKPKIYYSHGFLPQYIDWKQLPHANKPFSVIMQTKFANSVELLFPQTLHSSLSPLIASLPSPCHYVVTLPLCALLEPTFLSTFVKTTAPISMISRPLPGPFSPKYTLESGCLHLFLPKELYERCGLVGRPVRVLGTHAHSKQYFRVERNLLSPNMAKGKKGFDRLRKACEEVLTEPILWVVHDPDAAKKLALISGNEVTMLVDDTQPDRGPLLQETLATYNPQQRTALPVESCLKAVRIPNMRAPPVLTGVCASNRADESDDAVDMLDYISSLSIGSDRVYADDDIDPFLSRWRVPEPETATVGDIVRVRWRGMIADEWVRRLFLRVLEETAGEADAWLSLTGWTLGGDGEEGVVDGYTILRTQMDNEEGEDVDIGEEQQKTGKRKRKTNKRAEFLLWEMVDCVNS